MQFCGAAETVTGSRHLLTVDGRRFLIDCGLFQGKDVKERNWEPFPYPADSIEKVILTHAHIDHIGYLPKLYTEGYRGQIFCTSATDEITRLSLPDSGRLQEEFARYANKKGFSKHAPAKPLYTEKDALAVCKQLEPFAFDKLIELGGKCKIRFRRAGHILGSSYVEFWLPDGRMILFGGDLGRKNTPIIRDPDYVDAADFLLVESTYGDRLHPTEPIIDEFARVINLAVERESMVVIPAFAIGRTQEVLYYLNELENANKCPILPVYVDSPMAVDATGIYARHHEDHDLDMNALEGIGDNPLRSKNVTFVKSADQSKGLNKINGPGIIIASSGMASGGRVVHHLANRLPDPSNIILFVGFQAQGTNGRLLVEGAGYIRIMGQEIPVRAEIKSILSLSAHADANEIMDWLGGFKVPPKRTFIVHGEPPAQAALQKRIEKELGWATHIPKYLEEVEL